MTPFRAKLPPRSVRGRTLHGRPASWAALFVILPMLAGAITNHFALTMLRGSGVMWLALVMTAFVTVAFGALLALMARLLTRPSELVVDQRLLSIHRHGSVQPLVRVALDPELDVRCATYDIDGAPRTEVVLERGHAAIVCRSPEALRRWTGDLRIDEAPVALPADVTLVALEHAQLLELMRSLDDVVTTWVDRTRCPE